MPGRRTGSGVGYKAESPKQGKRFNIKTKTIHFAHLVILFIYALLPPTPFPLTLGSLTALVDIYLSKIIQ